MAAGLTHIPTHAGDAAERAFAEAALSERETAAARAVLAGFSAERTASVLGIAPSTVGNYRARAYEKLGVSGASELIARYGVPAEKAVEPDAALREALLARGLNATEADVLTLVAAGLSSSQIAARLQVAAGTVSAARAHGYRLLGIHSRDELAGVAAGTHPDAPPFARRAFLAANLVVCAAAAVYAGVYLAFLWDRVHVGYEGTWEWLLTGVAFVAAAFCAGQLGGFACSRFPWAKRGRPAVFVGIGAAAVLAYALLLVGILAFGSLEAVGAVWWISGRTGYVLPVAVGLVSGLGWGRHLRGVVCRS